MEKFPECCVNKSEEEVKKIPALYKIDIKNAIKLKSIL